VVTVTLGPPAITALVPGSTSSGTTLTLTISGSNLRDVVAVTAEPQTGLSFGTAPTVSADATQITLPLSVDSAAPTGPRVIRIFTLGGSTTNSASTANTLAIN
jgi:hypothetical protein